MMCYSGKDLARSFRQVRGNTIQIATEIPEDKWTFRATPETRSIAELVAHIAACTHYPRHVHMIDHKTFLGFEDFRTYGAASAAYEHTLSSRAEILRALQANGEQFAAELEAMDDAVLAEKVGFPPPIDPPFKTRFEMLLGVKEHEMHHRGQLMLMQRMVGLVPHLTRQRQARAQAQAQAAKA